MTKVRVSQVDAVGVPNGQVATVAGGMLTYAPVPAGAAHVVQDEGAALTQRASLNFAGAGVTATDDAVSGKTVVTIPGGGGAAVSARVFPDANVAMPNSTVVVIPHNTESFDTNNMHDNVTQNTRVTVPFAGLYLCVGTVKHSATSGQVQCRILQNGILVGITLDVATAVEIVQQNTQVVQCVPGDFIELAAFQGSGASRLAFGDASGFGTSLSVTFLGA